MFPANSSRKNTTTFMSEANVGQEFLKQRYPSLANSLEVNANAKRTASRSHTRISKDPEIRIQNYLDRFKEIIDRKDLGEREKGIKAIKKVFVNKFVVRVGDIPDSYWQKQMRVVRERGESGDWQTLSEEEKLKIKKDHLKQTKEDQQGSLEEWIDYLASEKSSYLPNYLKYWVFQGMLRLERYQKRDEEKGIKGKFPERPTGRQRSIKMFPEVNEKALFFIKEAFEAQGNGQRPSFRYDVPQEAREQFSQDLVKKDFRSLYGFGQEYMPPISEEEMQTTEGKWVLFNQNSNSKILAGSLQGKGSGWCIAGENMAGTYLSTGNLHIYYSRDREGKFTIPRVVIVQKGNRVTEVRGIEWEENADRYIKGTAIIADKLKQIPGGEAFVEIDKDIEFLTAIDRKMSSKQPITKDELTFLYELKKPIKYFGIKKDPRIKELYSQRRSIEEDMLTIFNCEKSQIAHSPNEINENTKAYVGKLKPGILDLLQKYHIENVYTRFPEGRISFETLEIGGIDFKKSFKELKEKFQIKDELKWSQAKEILEQVSADTRKLLSQLVEKQINISGYALDMLKSSDFTALKEAKSIIIVRLKVADLLSGYPTTDQIYAKAKELGLDLVPAEAGIHYRLKYKDQPLNEWLYMGMKQIAGRYGYPGVFRLNRGDGGLWLSRSSADPGDRWDPEDEWMFVLGPPAGEASKSEPKKLGLLDRLLKR